MSSDDNGIPESRLNCIPPLSLPQIDPCVSMTNCEPSSVMQLLPPPGIIPARYFGNVFIKPNSDEATFTSPTGLWVNSYSSAASSLEENIWSWAIFHIWKESSIFDRVAQESREHNGTGRQKWCVLWEPSFRVPTPYTHCYKSWGQVLRALSYNGSVNTEPFSRTVQWSYV